MTPARVGPDPDPDQDPDGSGRLHQHWALVQTALTALQKMAAATGHEGLALAMQTLVTLGTIAVLIVSAKRDR